MNEHGKAITIGMLVTVTCALPGFLAGALAVQLTSALDFGSTGIGAAVAAFFGIQAIASVHLGRLADRLGSAKSMRIATSGAAIAALAIAILATSWLTLTLFLSIAGLCAALAQPATNRLLINQIPNNQLGTAFGLKQSAPPAASALAGIAVPTLALSLGWQWAYAFLGVGALLMAGWIWRPRPKKLPSSRAGKGKPAKLRERRSLTILTLGFGSAFATSSTLLAFYVVAAVEAGIPEHTAGMIFAVAGLVTISVRLIAGAACDRYGLAPLHLSSTLIFVGASGIVLLSTQSPPMMAVGGIVAIAGVWGFPGVFWYALVSAYPEAPGRVTGLLKPAAIGGILGPISFGATTTAFGYRLAWLLPLALAINAAVVILIGGRNIDSRTRARWEIQH